MTQKSQLGPIRLATISTADFSASLEAYRDWLGYEVTHTGKVSQQAAQRWNAPNISGSRYATLFPPSGVGGGVRIIDGPAHPDFRQGTTHGWGALEVAVPDLNAVGSHLKGSPFRTISPPSPLGGEAAQALRAMQSVGPGGELIYFTEIMGEFPPFELPTSSGSIDGIFIMVVAASDLERTRGWFEQRFDVLRASDRKVAVKVTNLSFDLDPTTLHRISSLKLRDHSAIEIDQAPPAATPRPTVSGYLSPGICGVSMVSDNLQGEETLLIFGPDNLCIELISPDASGSLTS